MKYPFFAEHRSTKDIIFVVSHTDAWYHGYNLSYNFRDHYSSLMLDRMFR